MEIVRAPSRVRRWPSVEALPPLAPRVEHQRARKIDRAVALEIGPEEWRLDVVLESCLERVAEIEVTVHGVDDVAGGPATMSKRAYDEPRRGIGIVLAQRPIDRK